MTLRCLNAVMYIFKILLIGYGYGVSQAFGKCSLSRTRGTCDNILIADEEVQVAFYPNFCNNPLDVTFEIEGLNWHWSRNFINENEQQLVHGPQVYTALQVQLDNRHNDSLHIWAQLLVAGHGTVSFGNHSFDIPEHDAYSCFPGSTWREFLPLIAVGALVIVFLFVALLLYHWWKTNRQQKEKSRLFSLRQDSIAQKNASKGILRKNRSSSVIRNSKTFRKSMLSDMCELPYLNDDIDSEGSLHTNSTRNSYLISPSTSFMGTAETWFSDQAVGASPIQITSDNHLSQDVDPPQETQALVESFSSQPQYEMTPSRMRSFRGVKRGKKRPLRLEKLQPVYASVKAEGSPSPTLGERKTREHSTRYAEKGFKNNEHAGSGRHFFRHEQY